MWAEVLSMAVHLIERKGLEAVLPKRDLARVERFVNFWSRLDELPDWLQDVVMKLRLASTKRKLGLDSS